MDSYMPEEHVVRLHSWGVGEPGHCNYWLNFSHAATIPGYMGQSSKLTSLTVECQVQSLARVQDIIPVSGGGWTVTQSQGGHTLPLGSPPVRLTLWSHNRHRWDQSPLPHSTPGQEVSWRLAQLDLCPHSQGPAFHTGSQQQVLFKGLDRH